MRFWFGGICILARGVPLGELIGCAPFKTITMPKKSISQDRKRVSSQKHEVSYAGSKLGKGGVAKIRRAKSALGRTTSRKKVMAKAKSGR